MRQPRQGGLSEPNALVILSQCNPNTLTASLSRPWSLASAHERRKAACCVPPPLEQLRPSSAQRLRDLGPGTPTCCCPGAVDWATSDQVGGIVVGLHCSGLGQAARLIPDGPSIVSPVLCVQGGRALLPGQLTKQ